MIGILLILGASWLLLFFLENKTLSVLGYSPIHRRVLQIFIGFGFIILVQGLMILLETQILEIEWEYSLPKQTSILLDSLWYHFKSALTEDLLFRGAALYILANRFSSKTAVLTSAFLFGVYHWFSYGMFGAGIVPMLYVFIITGTTGAVWAYSYFKTNSIFLALGLHVAWNFVSTLFFDNQPYGELIFQQVSLTPISNEWLNLIFQFAKVLTPSILTYLFIKYSFKDNQE